MKRRPSGAGSVFKRGSVWYAQYYAGGKRVRFNTGVGTEEEAMEILRATIGRSRSVGMIDTWEADRSSAGAASELIVCADLLWRGFEVFRSVEQHCSCDLLAMRAGQILRVEVKTANNNRGHVSIRRQAGQFDVLAIVIKGKQIIYRPELPGLEPEATNEAPKRVEEIA